MKRLRTLHTRLTLFPTTNAVESAEYGVRYAEAKGSQNIAMRTQQPVARTGLSTGVM